MLLDTSGLLAYHNAAEEHHSRALSFFRGRRIKVVHGYILAEFVALAEARRLNRVAALRFARELVRHPRVFTEWVDESLHSEAMELLGERLDKAYSLCDAVSFILMRRRAIAEALTTDSHFEQEGFTRLLK